MDFRFNYARRRRWAVSLCEKISSIETGQPVVVVGTLYKEMKLKPCILDEYTKQSAAGAGARAHYMADDDYLVGDLTCLSP